ncbi:hypothetical protein GCM10022379_45920 [Micromonospora maritima]
MAVSGCQGGHSSPQPSTASSAAPAAAASYPALEGVELAAWVCGQVDRAVKDGAHGDPAVMRPIAEAAKQAGVDGFTFKGSVLLAKVDLVAARQATDPGVAIELQNNAMDLSWTCRGAAQRPGWPSAIAPAAR